MTTPTFEEFESLFPQTSKHWNVPQSVLKVLYLTPNLDFEVIKATASPDLRGRLFFWLFENMIGSSYNVIIFDVKRLKLLNKEAENKIVRLVTPPPLEGHPLSERWNPGLQTLNGLTDVEKNAFLAGAGNPECAGWGRFELVLSKLSEFVQNGNAERALAMRNCMIRLGTDRLAAIHETIQREMSNMPFFRIGLKDTDLVAVREWLRHENGCTTVLLHYHFYADHM
jgi:hypothetical protein